VIPVQQQNVKDMVIRNSALSRFGRYTVETEQPIRKARVRKNKAELLVKGYKALARFMGSANPRVPEMARAGSYEEALRIASSLKYTSRDIEAFMLSQAELLDRIGRTRCLGLFLSALVELGNETDYVLHTRHLHYEGGNLESIGYRNRKNLVINGDAGDGLGSFMSGGSIILRGDAGGYAGLQMGGGRIIIEGSAGEGTGTKMKDGSIIIRGDAGEYIGNEMEGGRIQVDGIADSYIGELMKGGRIHLNGDFGYITGNPRIREDQETESGRIYHKGRLVCRFENHRLVYARREYQEKIDDGSLR
jgi:formylmethanofuran dehydrogenase subunit C